MVFVVLIFQTVFFDKINVIDVERSIVSHVNAVFVILFVFLGCRGSC